MKRSKEHKEWCRLCKERDGSVCSVCGKPSKQLNVHHLVPRNFTEWALDIDNGLCLCPGCHTLGRWSAHKNPIWFTDWLCVNRFKQYMLARRRIEELKG